MRNFMLYIFQNSGINDINVRLYNCYGQVEKTKRYETNKRTTLKLKFSKKIGDLNQSNGGEPEKPQE